MMASRGASARGKPWLKSSPRCAATSRLAQAFADVGERAAGKAAKPVRRRLRFLDAAGLEIRKPGAKLRELRRREPQDSFFDLFRCHVFCRHVVSLAPRAGSAKRERCGDR